MFSSVVARRGVRQHSSKYHMKVQSNCENRRSGNINVAFSIRWFYLKLKSLRVLMMDIVIGSDILSLPRYWPNFSTVSVALVHFWHQRIMYVLNFILVGCSELCRCRSRSREPEIMTANGLVCSLFASATPHPVPRHSRALVLDFITFLQSSIRDMNSNYFDFPTRLLVKRSPQPICEIVACTHGSMVRC